MSIIRKKVTVVVHGAHVLVPKEWLGSMVYVVSDAAINELEELITITLLYRKAQAYEQSVLRKEWWDFRAEILTRLNRLDPFSPSKSTR